MVDAPAPRWGHVAVWTGDKMVVWGGALGAGYDNVTNTGAIYDPVADTWTATSLDGPPAPRAGAGAVWYHLNISEEYMVVWGGAVPEMTTRAPVEFSTLSPTPGRR
ncbi:MAG: hypothetical protein HY744_09910 [Deltaproteobacteria bacterium]|nr:hypothetical protein [Deltaproteobacteria bacterium]